MAGAVHIPWYATGFRGDQLAEALADIAAISLRYGASSYTVYRSRDDRYKFTQFVFFESKNDWNRYWTGPEFTRFRTVASSWYQVPTLYNWTDIVAEGAIPTAAALASENDAA